METRSVQCRCFLEMGVQKYISIQHCSKNGRNGTRREVLRHCACG